ncbi:thymidine kinase [Ornithinimicrobium pratense]|uniref:Thymidine kinase n=1 Tax=Ornithinimicrobium pratense TaxID=2593973 RepID=A0A5J6V568_9MICO|nr:thymidine kinase [Ornithinimicrobium pratense]QFG68326.1 thymidine kinase [Ornithinimicrobium pratense]
MAELVFFTGTMDCGKSTLALQMDHTHAARGRRGLLFTQHDRSGQPVVSSRLGLRRPALEVTDDVDFWELVVEQVTKGDRVDYLICDEAQFYTPGQVEQLARLVDEMGIDVFAFGISADFRTELFPGSRRLIELADRTEQLQVRALCWCGRPATVNARVVDGVMVVEGEQVVVGDVSGETEAGPATGPAPARGPGSVMESRSASGSTPPSAPAVEYEVLCRRHYMRRMHSAAARVAALSPDTLPFDLGLCPVPPR